MRDGKIVNGVLISHHPLYKSWWSILDRCYNKDCKDYVRYGARGIRVHEAWKDLEAFILDIESAIGPKPSEEFSLDRTNNNGNYEPGNVRWATSRLQALNRRRVVRSPYGYIGVSFREDRGKYVAKVKKHQKFVLRKQFDTPEDAARAVNQAYRIHNPEVPIPNPDVE